MVRGDTLKKFNQILGDTLALWLSTMGCFYVIFALVIVPLFFQHPSDFIGWVQYIVQSVFQGAALPLLGYVARVAGEKSERTLNDTHDGVMEELQASRNMDALLLEGLDELKVMHMEQSQRHAQMVEAIQVLAHPEKRRLF